MTTQPQKSPYLRVQRLFPYDELRPLANEMDHAYVDIASKVNERTIGLFAVNNQIVTGENWFISGQKQQTLRQVYTFTAAGAITHGINFASITSFTRGFGAYTDGTNWYGVIFGTSVAIAGEVSFYITPTTIVVLIGAGAPAITKGILVVEWLSQF